MTDEEIIEAIEASAHATSATGIFLNHAFCLLAQQPVVDLPGLIKDIRSLSKPDGDSTFKTIYESSRDLLLSNLESMLRDRQRDHTVK
jgi:hypothetical protein